MDKSAAIPVSLFPNRLSLCNHGLDLYIGFYKNKISANQICLCLMAGNA